MWREAIRSQKFELQAGGAGLDVEEEAASEEKKKVNVWSSNDLVWWCDDIDGGS